MSMENLAAWKDYREFKGEIEIREFCGFFLAVYQNAEHITKIMEQLESDLPHHYHISHKIDETEADFLSPLTCFVQKAEGRKAILHIKGLENLSLKCRIDFIGYLQHFKKAFISEKISVVLWVIPEFEKLLFFSLPDLYRQITGVYEFLSKKTDSKASGNMVSDSFKQEAIPVENIVAYHKEIIRQFKDWKAVKNKNEKFIIELMGQADLNYYYIPSYFRNNRGKTFLLDDLLNAFIENKTINFLTLLGDSKTGKSSFALHYFIRLAEEFVKNPKKQRRIPIFISLAGYQGRLDIEAFLIKEFQRIFNARLSLIQLQDFLLRGKFIFFIDGFDEMISKTDWHITRDNLEEIATLSLKNIILEDGIEKPHQGNKIFLTCKTHYFLVNIKESDHLKAGYTPLYKNYAVKENCQIVQIAPKSLDTRDMKTFILLNAEDQITARNILAIIDDPYNLNKLSTRPLLWEMIIRTIKSFKNKKEINAADLYRAYTDLWIKRDDWRFQIKPGGKRALMHQMATHIFRKTNDLTVHKSQLTLPEKQYIKGNLVHSSDSNWHDELRTCEFIIRDGEGNYRFVHKSFFDYFVAECYYHALKHGTAKPGKPADFHEEIRIFLKLIISSEKSNLRYLDFNNLYLEQANLYKADLTGTSLNKANLSRAVLINGILKEADLTAADLTMAKMTRIDLKGADLTGANFTNSGLREADLRGARFNGANFFGADLRMARLEGAKLAWVDFREANLKGANLTGANLSDADLSGADISNAILNEADLTGANLNKTLLNETEMTNAELSDADFTEADLTRANLTWAKLHGTILTLAKLIKAKLRETDLTRASLNDTDCTGADFRWSRLHHAKLQDAKFHEADFTGADLTKAKLKGADLPWANFTDSKLEGVDLNNARLNMVKFIDASVINSNLCAADMTWADLTNADFSKSDLSGANLSEADLTRAVLKDTKLKDTNFKGANLKKADLTNANYANANFEAADLTDTKMKP